MDYKCRYNGNYGCENCKHIEENGLIKCTMKNRHEIQCLYSSCPVVAGSVYPEGEHWCNICSFEPKEDEPQKQFDKALNNLKEEIAKSFVDSSEKIDDLLKNNTELNKALKEVRNMIMTEEEMDEQLEMMERLEEEGYYDEFVGEWVRVEDSLIDDGLITVKLSKEQIENILEFFDMRFIMFVQDEGNEIDNIWYLESMSTAYATLARAIGQEPKGA